MFLNGFVAITTRPTIACVRCQSRVSSFRGKERNKILAGVRLIGNQTIDSVLKDFLQEIRERRSPHEHAMGSGHDSVDMFDVQGT